MALSVNTNVSSLTAQRNLVNSSSRLNTNLERLSTGLKINKSADDASGLVISEFQRAQISGLEQGVANVDRAVNLVQTAESGLSEINSLLLNVRQLAVDSANAGANDADALAANQAEVDNLLGTIDRIASTTKFGTIKVLNGDSGLRGQATGANVEVLRATDGSVASTDITLAITQQATRSELTAGTAITTTTVDETLSVNGVDISLESGLNADQVVNRINEFSGQTGAFAVNDAGTVSIRANEFGSQTRVTVLSNVDTAGATVASGFGTSFQEDSSGLDVAGTFTFATATSTGIVSAIGRGNVLTGDAGGDGSGISVRVNAAVSTDAATSGGAGSVIITDNSRKFQIGAFADSGNFDTEAAKIALNGFSSDALGIGVSGSRFQTLSSINVETFDGAQDAIAVIDKAISDVSTTRGDIGAFQKNTLQASQSKNRSELQNLQEAESTVRDTDFTTEIAKFTSEQIRNQAATTVLGLANQSAQSILSLLG